jgi:hypothetical protein
MGGGRTDQPDGVGAMVPVGVGAGALVAVGAGGVGVWASAVGAAVGEGIGVPVSVGLGAPVPQGSGALPVAGVVCRRAGVFVVVRGVDRGWGLGPVWLTDAGMCAVDASVGGGKSMT